MKQNFPICSCVSDSAGKCLNELFQNTERNITAIYMMLIKTIKQPHQTVYSTKTKLFSG